jgi:flagellar hook-basal body complex protein FliE
MIAPVLAAAAYQATQAAATVGAEAVSGFGGMLQRAVEGALDVGHSADAASSQAMLGQGSVSDLVMAVSRAELALQATVAIRDRVVSAYQDVMRMPI